MCIFLALCVVVAATLLHRPRKDLGRISRQLLQNWVENADGIALRSNSRPAHHSPLLKRTVYDKIKTQSPVDQALAHGHENFARTMDGYIHSNNHVYVGSHKRQRPGSINAPMHSESRLCRLPSSACAAASTQQVPSTLAAFQPPLLLIAAIP